MTIVNPELQFIMTIDKSLSKDSSTSVIDVQKVRFSLEKLLGELKLERRISALARESVDQTDISNLFEKKKRVRRAKKQK